MESEFFILTQTLQILLRFQPSEPVPDAVGLGSPKPLTHGNRNRRPDHGNR
jgi:hypothetical protein